jgi:hypothetical protein
VEGIMTGGTRAAPFDTDVELVPVPQPAWFPNECDGRATLTVLTGPQAGKVVTVNGAPVTIGRADDADLVVDEPGLSLRHARFARTPGGSFYVEDLQSTNGTLVGATRVGVALVRQMGVLQLGPDLRVRFAVVDCPPDARSCTRKCSCHRGSGSAGWPRTDE